MENFNDPLSALLLGVDDEKMEDIDLQEVIDKAIRKEIASDGITEEEVNAKVEKTKKRLANFISSTDRGSMNPLFLLLGMFGLGGNMMTDGLRGNITDKDGNVIPEDVFKNEYMPMFQKAGRISALVTSIEKLTEENTCMDTVPLIVQNIFVCKDDLLDLLKGHEAWLQSEMAKIVATAEENKRINDRRDDI